jgi:hypothetical protein
MSKGKPTNRHGFKEDLRNQRIPLPATLQELADLVRTLRRAQNHAYFETNNTRKYHLQDVALRLGREIDYCLRMLEINDKIQHP